ncbi:unnamed protein product [Closterium sp. NIES-54]
MSRTISIGRIVRGIHFGSPPSAVMSSIPCSTNLPGRSSFSYFASPFPIRTCNQHGSLAHQPLVRLPPHLWISCCFVVAASYPSFSGRCPLLNLCQSRPEVNPNVSASPVRVTTILRNNSAGSSPSLFQNFGTAFLRGILAHAVLLAELSCGFPPGAGLEASAALLRLDDATSSFPSQSLPLPFPTFSSESCQFSILPNGVWLLSPNVDRVASLLGLKRCGKPGPSDVLSL